jgi:hypothetical protein
MSEELSNLAEPAGQPGQSGQDAPGSTVAGRVKVWVSQRSKVLQLERTIKELKAQITALRFELSRKRRAQSQQSRKRYRCLHCGRVGPMSGHNLCMRLVQPAQPAEANNHER